MAKKANKTDNVVNNTVLTFNASIYQMNRAKTENTFCYSLKGETNNEELKNEDVAKYLSEKIFKVVKAQNNIKEVANKCRFFKLASTKAIYFQFSLNGQTLFNTMLFENIKIKLQGIEDAKQLQVILSEVLNIFACANDTL